jgi:polar amino acid transport system substrate-binding protein
MSSGLRVVAVSLLLGVACTSGDGATLAEAVADDGMTLVTDGTLTVCATVPFEPFSYEDDQAPHGYGGFDIALVDAIAERLELDLRVEDVAFEDITSGTAMADGRCDVAASALTITDAWDRSLDFTIPYFRVKQSLLVREGTSLTELRAANGMRIGVQVDMPSERFAEAQVPGDAEVIAFDTTADLLAALDLGELDAVIQDLPTSTAWIDAGAEVSVVETFVTGDTYAMAVAAGREDALLREIDAQLEAILEDGTRDRLLASFFSVPGAMVEPEER